jgi:hypothetical protein
MTIRGARDRVRTARRLVDMPLVSAAFATGELSYSKVRALARVADWEEVGSLALRCRLGCEDGAALIEAIEAAAAALMSAGGAGPDDAEDGEAGDEGGTAVPPPYVPRLLQTHSRSIEVGVAGQNCSGALWRKQGR